MTDLRMDPTDALQRALQRRDRVAHSLIESEHALAAPVDGRESAWRERVELAVLALRNAFGAHVGVTEEGGGLFDEVTTQAPRLSHRVDVLRREHAVISDSLQRSIRSIDLAVDPDVIRRDLTALLARIARHRQRGADLLYEAYDVDLGFAD